MKPHAKIYARMSSLVDEHMVICTNAGITTVKGVLYPFQFLVRELLAHRCVWYLLRKCLCDSARVVPIQLLEYCLVAGMVGRDPHIV